MAEIRKVYTTNDEDKELVERYLAGDTRAFTPLFHKFKNVFFFNATRWFGYKEDEIEDMAMEFLGRMSVSLHKYDRTKATVGTWMTNCMRNYMHEYHTRKGGKPIPGKFFDDMGFTDGNGDRQGFDPESNDGTVVEIERMSHRKIIREMIESLSAMDARIFQEHFINGLTQKETAEKLGIPVNTMWYKVSLIRKHLERFKDEI